ncbi:AB hydrolase superfamily protein C4A8.06c [Trametes pubescens]|uniref:AB hydrolase superfamily protein C4A8.06c n=1 Tax=Trametes pubescens TaxID=154538 RepID=A0A1M2V310_TRAPU|nr:AB hydrolase superfamily protein C4A8.06c [Trametes pubescens]
MVNSLTRQAGLKLGPIILDVLIKHYFERVSKDNEEQDMPKLLQEELLYDEAFNIIKSFMEAATKHTVEELQSFSNTRTPSPPWVHAVRLLVPMSCCDDAAKYLIKALGGEEVTKRVVGGTKWWQVRGLKGVDGEWIVAKKDWQEAKRRQKARESTSDGGPSLDASQPSQEMPATYQPEMDEMRCILYAHGGGYYFGSFDQERYCIQRLARKINGRVFAVNYRLAPQYPFPCAIQDFVAAYLYLIRPPPGALHTPVSPSNIVVSGDSAGGGLCIALLQVIRDSGLPPPAGAVLISPWCDLTHSFPSIHLNTATDIIPQYGLSFHKPSTLWPPPPDELTTQVRQGLRSRIRDALRHKPKDGQSVREQSDIIASEKHPSSEGQHHARATTPDHTVTVPENHSRRSLHLGSAVALPLPLDGGVRSQQVSLKTQTGETLSIDGQIHMYAPNFLLTHPLVSPVVSYLGGLPPMLVIASDKEVLRDEIIYLAHKAAHPDKYPVKPEVKIIYPALDGIEERYGPTKIHLQNYDDAAHTLPVLFAFTTPGKFCFRAMATFIKHVSTGRPRAPAADLPTVLEHGVTTVSPATSQSDLSGQVEDWVRIHYSNPELPSTLDIPHSEPAPESRSSNASGADNAASVTQQNRLSVNGTQRPSQPPAAEQKSVRRSFTARVSRASVFLRRSNTIASTSASETGQLRESSGSSDVGGPRFHEKPKGPDGVRYAGEPSVYDNGLDTMIRERVSTRGVIRPLEPESELSAFMLPPERIGEVSELALRRYIDGSAKFGKKFGKTTKAVEKARRRTLERAKLDTMRNMAQLQTFFSADDEHSMPPRTWQAEDGEGSSARAVRNETAQGVKEGLAASGSWAWAWALDADEHPPPSSIVARRDTEEARRLAKIADQAVLMDDQAVSGNNLWSLIVNFLTVTPDRDAHKLHKHKYQHAHVHSNGQVEPPVEASKSDGKKVDKEGAKDAEENKEKKEKRERFVSRFARLVTDLRKSRGTSAATANGKAGQ